MYSHLIVSSVQAFHGLPHSLVCCRIGQYNPLHQNQLRWLFWLQRIRSPKVSAESLCQNLGYRCRQNINDVVICISHSVPPGSRNTVRKMVEISFDKSRLLQLENKPYETGTPVPRNRDYSDYSSVLFAAGNATLPLWGLPCVGLESVTEHIFHQRLGGWDCPFQLCGMNINLRNTCSLNHFELCFWLRLSLYYTCLNWFVDLRTSLLLAMSVRSHPNIYNILLYIFMFFLHSAFTPTSAQAYSCLR